MIFKIRCVFVTILHVVFKQEEVKTLRARVEEVIKENKNLQDEAAKSGVVRQEDW